MPPFVRTRLSAMMFLFFFSLGAWAVTLSTFLMSSPLRGGLYFTTSQVGWIYSTYAIGGMLAPIFIGLLADRLFHAERVLGVACLMAGGLLAASGYWCDVNLPKMDATYREVAAGELVAGRPVLEYIDRLDAVAGVAPLVAVEVQLALDRVKDSPAVRQSADDTFTVLFLLMLGQCFAAQLAMTLTTVIALRNLPDPMADFSRTRMWGTVGWIVAGNSLGLFLTPVSSDPLYLAAGSALLCGIYCFTLPPTPPKGFGRRLADVLGLPALKLFRDRSFIVFIFVAFGAATINQFYGVYGHRYLTDLQVPRPEQVMTVAQVIEVCCMFAIPLLRPREWMKWLMILGLIGWLVRGVALTTLSPEIVVAFGVPMHGCSYAFFHMVAATYIDREAPPHLRASAQGIISFAASGAGPWAGNLFAAAVVDAHRVGTSIDWYPVWIVPAIGSAIMLLIFTLLFKPPPE